MIALGNEIDPRALEGARPRDAHGGATARDAAAGGDGASGALDAAHRQVRRDAGRGDRPSSSPRSTATARGSRARRPGQARRARGWPRRCASRCARRSSTRPCTTWVPASTRPSSGRGAKAGPVHRDRRSRGCLSRRLAQRQHGARTRALKPDLRREFNELLSAIFRRHPASHEPQVFERSEHPTHRRAARACRPRPRSAVPSLHAAPPPTGRSRIVSLLTIRGLRRRMGDEEEACPAGVPGRVRSFWDGPRSSATQRRRLVFAAFFAGRDGLRGLRLAGPSGRCSASNARGTRR